MKKRRQTLKKEKKPSEKEKLQFLLQQMTMNVYQNKERVERCRQLSLRESTKKDADKSQRNQARLEEARRSLEESIVFLEQIKESLEKL